MEEIITLVILPVLGFLAYQNYLHRRCAGRIEQKVDDMKERLNTHLNK